MKNIIYIILVVLTVAGCKKQKTDLYSEAASIYFAGDRLVDFTFSKYKTNEFVLHIPVEIGGYKSAADREFMIQVVPDSTTAVAGTHYKALPVKLVMPADSFKIQLPMVLYNNDPRLISEKVRLYLRLVPNSNFLSGIYYRQDLDLYISDILLKPKIWDSKYTAFFGTYSRNKHKKILEICDISEIPDVYDGGPYDYKWDAFGRAVNNFYRENYPQYDENNQIINPWM